MSFLSTREDQLMEYNSFLKHAHDVDKEKIKIQIKGGMECIQERN